MSRRHGFESLVNVLPDVSSSLFITRCQICTNISNGDEGVVLASGGSGENFGEASAGDEFGGEASGEEASGEEESSGDPSSRSAPATSLNHTPA